jgi:hypothetical protein
LDGFVQKWIKKLDNPEVQDLSGIENEINKLLETEDDHIDLISTCEMVVGSHFESEKALREALRAFKTDIDGVIKVNEMLVEENTTLNSFKTLKRFKSGELIKEIFVRIFDDLKEEIAKIKGGGKSE